MGAEGLIIAEGQRGFEVAPVSADDFRQVAALRLLLENHALEQSFTAGDLDWEGRVVSAHHKLAVMEKRMLEGQRQTQELWKQCDWDFHHALISACGSDVLLSTHALIYDRYLRYQMIAVVFRGEIATREHQALLESALKRDWKTGAGHHDFPHRGMRRSRAPGRSRRPVQRRGAIRAGQGCGKRACFAEPTSRAEVMPFQKSGR